MKSEFVEDGMETQISDLCARLERLEKENRRMKRVGMITVVFTLCLAKTSYICKMNDLAQS